MYKPRTIAINEDKLIELVEKNKCIYDRKSENYCKSRIKEQAWKDIARCLDQPVDICKKKWKSLRDSFVRLVSANGGVVDPDRSAWPHFYQMLFLEDHIGYNKRSSENKKEVYDSFEAKTENENSYSIQSDDTEVVTYFAPEEAIDCFLKEVSDGKSDRSSPEPKAEDVLGKKRKLDPYQLACKEFSSMVQNVFETRLKDFESQEHCFLKTIEGYINQVDGSAKKLFKLDILNYVHMRFNELNNADFAKCDT